MVGGEEVKPAPFMSLHHKSHNETLTHLRVRLTERHRVLASALLARGGGTHFANAIGVPATGCNSHANVRGDGGTPLRRARGSGSDPSKRPGKIFQLWLRQR
jgi:hypothetical protein